MKRIGIFGTSGHAREVGDVAWDLGYEPVYVARDAEAGQAWSFPGDLVLESDIGRYADMPFAIGIGGNAARAAVAQRYVGMLRFANLVHPSATFGRGQRDRVDARSGVVVCAGVRLTNNIGVGHFAVFNRNCNVGHDCLVEDFVHIAPCACVSGNVHLGRACWIGAGAVVNQGTPEAPLAVGADCIVGSGSVVTRACEAGGVYAGAPATRIR